MWLGRGSTHACRGDSGLDRPRAVVLMAEYGDVFLWEHLAPAEWHPGSRNFLPSELGVTEGLAERLAAWNDEWQDLAYANVDPAAPEVKAWADRGWALAQELQAALPDIEVLYHHGPHGERAVRGEQPTAS